MTLALSLGCPKAPYAPSFTSDGERAAAKITRESLIEPIRTLSSDAYQGRGPATRGDVRTRRYLSEQLEQMGYEPAASDGSWEQSFEIIGVTAAVPGAWIFERGKQKVELQRWEQFIAASGVQAETAEIEGAEVVFVGYGIDAPEYDWDDYKGADVSGKILLVVNNDPHWDPDLFEGETRLYYGRWDYKYANAARHGAAGVIIIHTVPSAGYPWQVVQSSWTGEQFELPDEGNPRLKIASWVTEAGAQEIALLAGRDLSKLVESARSRDFRPVPLDVTTSLKLANTLSRKQTANVLGLLPGSDPTLRDEVVIYTAHHDHLGIGEPDDSGDRIYNGAMDNAAGVAQVLSIARAFPALPLAPKRSILMLFVAAEEQGLLGSQYYAAHSTFAPGRIAANLNYDGGNIWGRARDITCIGLEKSSLEDVVRRVADHQGRDVAPDQFPDRGYYYRSDQFSFANIGVPAIFCDSGTDFVDRPAGWGRQQMEKYEAERYHQPADELDDSWSFDGMIEDARLGFWAGWFIANDDKMPAWKSGDEFEAVRKRAIKSAP